MKRHLLWSERIILVGSSAREIELRVHFSGSTTLALSIATISLSCLKVRSRVQKSKIGAGSKMWIQLISDSAQPGTLEKTIEVLVQLISTQHEAYSDLINASAGLDVKLFVIALQCRSMTTWQRNLNPPTNLIWLINHCKRKHFVKTTFSAKLHLFTISTSFAICAKLGKLIDLLHNSRPGKVCSSSMRNFFY